MVEIGASSHKINYIEIFSEILNPEAHQNCYISSNVPAILLNGWILSISGVASGRVCACSYRSRLVSLKIKKEFISAITAVLRYR